MRKREYYSIRTGQRNGDVNLTLDQFKKLFLSLYKKYDVLCYFQQAFGTWCVDAGLVPGTLGPDVNGAILLTLRKEDLWPVWERIEWYEEADIFDIIEFLFDTISKPIDGHYHNYSDCGWHYNTFNKAAGQDIFRKEVNQILSIYGKGYELSAEGEILEFVEDGLAPLIEASLPTFDPENVEGRVQIAVNKFRRYRSSLEDRKNALRDLADVLEYLRPTIKNVLDSKDEADLFNIANNFGVRHHNRNQKTDYDQSIWCSWMFYYYLATIHACIRFRDKAKKNIGTEAA